MGPDPWPRGAHSCPSPWPAWWPPGLCQGPIARSHRAGFVSPESRGSCRLSVLPLETNLARLPRTPVSTQWATSVCVCVGGCHVTSLGEQLPEARGCEYPSASRAWLQRRRLLVSDAAPDSVPRRPGRLAGRKAWCSGRFSPISVSQLCMNPPFPALSSLPTLRDLLSWFATRSRCSLQMFSALPFLCRSSSEVRPPWGAAHARASEGRAVAGRASEYTLITRAGPR